jgi:aspartyl/asparaginyl beta-hydroxylase (cupin superfamily)
VNEPALDPQQANTAGMAALRAGDPASAARHFAAAAAADPSAVPLWRNLANAHRLAGNTEGERSAIDRGLNADRSDFILWLRKAQLHQRLNEDGPALHAWSGVMQMASAMGALPDGLTAELQAGSIHLASLQERLATAVDAGVSARINVMATGEARRARAFVDHAMGRRRVYQNECLGLLYPFLPADEFFDDHHFPWFPALSAAAPAIRAELEALIARDDLPLRPYVRMDEGTPVSKWTALDNNLAWGAAFLWEYGVANQPLLDRCPATAAALAAVPRANIPGRAPSAFFSLLRPRTRIPPHTGVSNTRAIVHLPLIVPPNCGFRVGGETRLWEEGRPFAFDDTIEHEAWNDSDELRAVLIFDVWNPHLSVDEQALIADYYAAADGSGLSPEQRDI